MDYVYNKATVYANVPTLLGRYPMYDGNKSIRTVRDLNRHSPTLGISPTVSSALAYEPCIRVRTRYSQNDDRSITARSDVCL